ncbi:MAG: TolB family protein [Thermoanaerobaculia bacterium]
MLRRRFAFRIGWAVLLALPAVLGAQGPAGEWRTFETPHYRIHYTPEFEDWARRAAAQIESIHERVTSFVGYAPGQRVEVIVQDPAASANGLAFPFLDRPAIVLWTSPPEAETAVGYYHDWAEILLTHEMAHIVHLVRPRNRPTNFLRRLSPLPLGPIVLKAPRWLIEGYATLVEGALTGSGRPYGTFRPMVIRRFGLEGKLPDYASLSSVSGWAGGVAPYLVGSTFLEWLEAREGKGSLQKLWKRLASRRGGNFARGFRAIFGESPGDLYDRFRAEMTAHALAEEQRLEKAGLVQGELWQRLEGATSSLQISPDGKRLLARRVPRPERGLLAVWTIEETEEERREEERRREKEEKLLEDPEEVPDKPPAPRPRRPKWTLPAIDRGAPREPRWMPDGQRVLFAMRTPDAEGRLRADLHVWDVDSGGVERLTRLADVVTADPSPDGLWAAAVENRHGHSRLVRVDLGSGAVAPLGPPASEDPWRIWIHPRVSPDGGSIAALVHSAPRWRLVVVDVRASGAREIALPGSPAGPPAWGPDGKRIFLATDVSGIWNLLEVSPDGAFEPRRLTRVTGGALSPAPHPREEALFYLDITAKGVSIRRLAPGDDPVAAVDRPATAPPVLPPPAIEMARPALTPVGEPRRYRLFDSHVWRVHTSSTTGPDGSSYAIGADGSDVLGRLHWVAAAAVGDDAGPRGLGVSAAYRGFRVEIRPQIFFAEEEPGEQELVHRAEFDQKRFGGFLGLAWERVLPGGHLRLEGGAGATRIDGGTLEEAIGRSLGSLRVRAAKDRTRGIRGLGADVSANAVVGHTSTDSWNQIRGEMGISLISELGRLRASAAAGETGGAPTRFDLFAVGGAPSEILSAEIDSNRIDSPALPGYVQVGERFEVLRAELFLRGVPLRFYGERLRAWTGDDKPPAVRVLGAELRLRESLLSLNIPGSFDLYIGVARLRSETPRLRSTRGYGGLIFRP